VNRSLSVVVPALNEADNLEATVDAVRRALSDTVRDFEIIVVDDGSTDATGQIADRIAAAHTDVRVLHNALNRGFGASFARGLDMAHKDAAMFVPGDNGWPYRSLRQLFAELGTADVVSAYTTNPEIRPLARRMMSRCYTALLNVLFGRRVQYYNGLAIYPLDFLRKAPFTTRGFGFMAETLLNALAAGLTHREIGVPICDRAAGDSKALRFRNVVSVASTIGRLVWVLRIRGRVPTATSPRDVARK
jgi:glycosyltransferase involved in cell wall biosynthesis